MAGKKLVYAKFFPSDWLGDASLRAVSLQARGLWIDLLCLMWSSPDCGQLRFISGRNPEHKMISKSLGIRHATFTKLFAELRDAGVLSVGEDGTIYCRRIIREERLRREAVENGAKGGNPNLLKGVNPPVNGAGYPAPGIYQSPESKDHNPKPDSLLSESIDSQLSALPEVVTREPAHVADQVDAAVAELIQTWNGLSGTKPYTRSYLGHQRRETLRRWMFGPNRLDWRQALAKFPLRCFVGGEFQPTLGWFVDGEHAGDILDGKYDFSPQLGSSSPASGQIAVRLGDMDGGSDQ